MRGYLKSANIRSVNLKKVIIFEVGRKAREIAKKIGREHVECFADSSPENLTPITGIPVISFDEMIQRWPECDIILSINSEELEQRLQACGLKYWRNENQQNSYFMRQDIIDLLDEKLLDRYHYDTGAKAALFSKKTENYFREEYFSETNRLLVEAFRAGDQGTIQTMFDRIYASNELHFDERYDTRPGIRLVKNILAEGKRCHTPQYKICDLACGHGELLKALKEEGFQVQGIEKSAVRAEEVKKSGINCILAEIEHTPLPDSTFDVITCMECLEHVGNPIAVVKEMYRLLKRGGMAFCTTPYGFFCDCNSHLRQFNETSLCALFLQNGFEIKNVLRIPYLNFSVDDNLFVAAVKCNEGFSKR